MRAVLSNEFLIGHRTLTGGFLPYFHAYKIDINSGKSMVVKTFQITVIGLGWPWIDVDVHLRNDRIF